MTDAVHCISNYFLLPWGGGWVFLLVFLFFLCCGCFTPFLQSVEIWHWKACQKNLQALSSIHIGAEVVKRSYAGLLLALLLWFFKRQQSQNAQMLACCVLFYKTLRGFPLKGEDIPISNSVEPENSLRSSSPCLSGMVIGLRFWSSLLRALEGEQDGVRWRVQARGHAGIVRCGSFIAGHILIPMVFSPIIPELSVKS